MKPTHLSPLAVMLAACLCSVQAQTVPADTVTNPAAVTPQSGASAATATPTPTAKAVERRFEHIQVEDSGARIDERRLGGDTQSITVHPKGTMPAYQIAPVSGDRTWKVLGF